MKMKKFINARTIGFTICVCVLLVSLFQIGMKLRGYADGSSSYEKAEQLFGLTVPEDDSEVTDVSTQTAETDPLIQKAAKYFKDCNFDPLTAVNPEILGWIVIPKTNISYPICQHDDNQYYLEHTSQNEASFVGAIFADYRVEQPFEEYNTILYGHRLLNQTMFSALKTYRQKDVWKKQPYIYIYTPQNLYVYEIYAVFQGDPQGISYHTSIQSVEKKQAFIDYSLSCAEFETGITPTTEDSFLTLSTCTGTGHAKRLILHSVLRASAPVEDLP